MTGPTAGGGVAATIRPAAPDDLPAVRAILAAHGNDDPPGQLRGPDVVGPYLRHLLAAHRVLVSDLPGAGVVAFGAVADVGSSWHLADLFALPERVGQGLGRPLLAALYGDHQWPRTTFASEHPLALPVYVRAGMAARWVALYLRAGPDAVRRAADDPCARGVEVIGGDPARLAALEREWTGADRTRDHGYWTAMSGSDPFLVQDVDGPVGLGYGRDRQTGPSARAVDRLVVRPGADPVGPVLAVLARCLAAGSTLDITLPGPHPVLQVLLEHGFRIEERDTYCSGPTDPVDAERLIPNGGLL